MSDNLARARAREAAEAWLAERRTAQPTPPRVSAAFAEQAMVDAFAAGHEAGEGRFRTAWEELSRHLAWVQEAGSALFDLMPRALGRNIAEVATDLVAAAYPSLRPAIGRDGQDVKAGPVKGGPGIKISHSDALAIIDYARTGQTREIIDAMEGLIEERRAEVRADLGGNPAEVLRDIAEGMVDGETIKGVDHASFDRAAAMANEIIVSHEPPQPAPWRQEGVADLAAFRITTGDPRFDPAGPVTINGFLYQPAKENEHG